MENITEVGCKSYQEDLRTYDDKDYQIKYADYDCKLSFLVYQMMIFELTDYHLLEQPEKDYLCFGKTCNNEVIALVEWFKRNHQLYLLTKSEYSIFDGHKGKIHFFGEFFYGIKNKQEV